MHGWCATILLLTLGGSKDPEGNRYLLAGSEKFLREHRIGLSDRDLLDFFRSRTLTGPRMAGLRNRISRFTAPNYAERNQAQTDILKEGPGVRFLLLDLVRDEGTPLEIRRRCELCLKELPAEPETSLAVAAARLLGHRRPPETTQVLLDYLPFAPAERLRETIRDSLAAAVAGNKAGEAACRAALTHPHPLTRAAAGEALIRGLGPDRKPATAALLDDPVPLVRARIAAALVEARDREGLPILIEAFADLPAEDRGRVEELLLRVAGEGAPSIWVDAENTPNKVQRAWQDWWARNGTTLDLSRFDQQAPLRGYTLVTYMATGPGLDGRVLELRPNREKHWEIDKLRYPLDAQVLGKDRVLIAEYLGRRVSERDLDGKILWEKQVDMPIACRRFPGGKTFIATRKSLLLVDRAGKEMFVHHHGGTSITAAARMRDGRMLFVDATGRCFHLDADGRELRSFPVGQIYSMGGNLDLVPGGRFLVPLYRENQVVEYDLEGNKVWQAGVPAPISAVRLPTGNTLVVSRTQQTVVELDRDGRETWSRKIDGRPWRARQR